MKVFAIGDLHLPGNSDKPMNVFGTGWDRHFERISENWRAIVTDQDLVLIPGDISWAMRLTDAMTDIMAISKLPGTKIIIRGNHDYWWSSIGKIRNCLPDGIIALQNDSITINGIAIAGTRGWVCPGSAGFDSDDERIYRRELTRMELSLSSAAKYEHIICMIHYPPFNERRQESGFSELFSRYCVDKVVYGHLHGKSCAGAFEGCLNGVEYILCSCDHINLTPKLICNID